MDSKFIDTNVDIKAVEIPDAEVDGKPVYTVEAGEPHPDAEVLTVLLTRIADENVLARLFHTYYHRLFTNEVPIAQQTGFIAKLRRLFS